MFFKISFEIFVENSFRKCARKYEAFPMSIVPRHVQTKRISEEALNRVSRKAKTFSMSTMPNCTYFKKSPEFSYQNCPL
jgi:hypothetical protein